MPPVWHIQHPALISLPRGKDASQHLPAHFTACSKKAHLVLLEEELSKSQPVLRWNILSPFRMMFPHNDLEGHSLCSIELETKKKPASGV